MVDDDWPGAGQTLALRVAAPVALGKLGDVIDGLDGHRGVTGALVGISLGILGAQVVDWTLISAPDSSDATPRLLSLAGRF